MSMKLLEKLKRPHSSPMEARLDRMEEMLKAVQRSQKRTKEQLDAILRAQYIDSLGNDGFPEALTRRRFRLMSQNEEDGIVLGLLQLAGCPSRSFVEIGCGANGGNSGVLAAELGWRGLMVDSSERRIDECKMRFGGNGRIQFHCASIAAENINAVIEAHAMRGEIDFFSLDIDSWDYWVFRALNVVNPRVVVLEYNAAFGAEARVTVPENAPVDLAPKGYHGASLRAMTELADSRGCRLLACDPSGTNAFFLRKDIRDDIPPVPVEQAFRHQAARYDMEGGQLRKIRDPVELAKRHGLPLVWL